MAWTCPVCKQKFNKTNQWHSCVTYDLQFHFRGKGMLRELFEELVNRIDDLRPFEVNPVKTSIQFRSDTTFLSIAVKKSHLELSFELLEKYPDFPVARHLQISKNRWVHIVPIDEIDDINGQLLDWLKEARYISNT